LRRTLAFDCPPPLIGADARPLSRIPALSGTYASCMSQGTHAFGVGADARGPRLWLLSPKGE